MHSYVFFNILDVTCCADNQKITVFQLFFETCFVDFLHFHQWESTLEIMLVLCIPFKEIRVFTELDEGQKYRVLWFNSSVNKVFKQRSPLTFIIIQFTLFHFKDFVLFIASDNNTDPAIIKQSSLLTCMLSYKMCNCLEPVDNQYFHRRAVPALPVHNAAPGSSWGSISSSSLPRRRRETVS